ncbi:protein kinase family protein, partial [Streptomyces sp. NPDC002920]
MPPGRRITHQTVATALDRLSDDELTALLASGVPLGTGIGGQVLRVEVAGRPVFVKRIRLTDTERLPRHSRSTANTFGLPSFCHYGIGSPGFGAWRELA